MFLHSFRLFLLLWLLSGCAVKVATPQESNHRIEQLTHLILDMNGSIAKNEAMDLAKSSVLYAEKLAGRYRVVSPPWWQNTLVNMGFKERGLCYEWADDLWVYLGTKQYKTVKLHYIGANIGTFLEHNALSVSAKKMGLEESIVLDAWRDSGRLFFIEIDKDTKYDWKNRFP